MQLSEGDPVFGSSFADGEWLSADLQDDNLGRFYVTSSPGFECEAPPRNAGGGPCPTSSSGASAGQSGIVRSRSGSTAARGPGWEQTRQSLIDWRGNRCSVPPELAAAKVIVHQRLDAAVIDIATASGTFIARHQVAGAGLGARSATPATSPPPKPGSALFQVINQCFLKTPIVITTNRHVGAWGEILGDTTAAAAMLDRLLHRSVVITLDGASYRLRNHHAVADELRRVTTGTKLR